MKNILFNELRTWWLSSCLAMALGLCISFPAGAEPPQGKCQAAMGGPQEAELGCVGRIGLMRLSRESYTAPKEIRAASMALFGQEALPEPGAEITLRRPAQLRERYDERRDEQIFSACDTCLNQYIYCTGWCEVAPRQKYCRGHFPSQFKSIASFDCPGPTDQTQYFGINTRVKILGYQVMGSLFVQVQIVAPDSRDPVAVEPNYDFDRSAVF